MGSKEKRNKEEREVLDGPRDALLDKTLDRHIERPTLEKDGC